MNYLQQLFDEGEYIVRANYLSTQTESRFSVANDFVFGGDADLSLLLDVDKSEYYPGDTVVCILGKPTKLIYIDKFEVSITSKKWTMTLIVVHSIVVLILAL